MHAASKQLHPRTVVCGTTSVATRAIRRRKTFFLLCPRYFLFPQLFFVLCFLLVSFNFLVEELAHRLPNEIHTTRHRSQPRSTCVYVRVCVCTYTYTYTYIHTYVSLSRRKSEMGAVSCVLEKYQDPVRFRFVRSIKTVYTRVCMCVCVCGLLNREITSSCSRQILKNHKSKNDSKKTIR